MRALLVDLSMQNDASRIAWQRLLFAPSVSGDLQMSLRINSISAPKLIALCAALMVCDSTAATAQSSGSIELHANEAVNAASVGLPEYPNARPYRESKSDSAVDVGFTFGSFHFRLLAAKYISSASPSQVLDFYRKPLSRYGDVLECERGESVGSLAVTRSGLTCSNSSGRHAETHGDTNAHELRSGTPRLFRIVAVDETRTDATHFTLLLLEIPEDKGSD
jgi:hypothetical protein